MNSTLEKTYKSILLCNENLNSNSRVSIIYSNEKIETTMEKSIKLQKEFRMLVKNGEYKNNATGYIASITSETKSKITNPSQRVNKRGKEYILRMISAKNLPELFKICYIYR